MKRGRAKGKIKKQKIIPKSILVLNCKFRLAPIKPKLKESTKEECLSIHFTYLLQEVT
jgi:hypothetical protein